MTNKEFIRRLRKAKKEALRLWPSIFCVSQGCGFANLAWEQNCILEPTLHDFVKWCNGKPSRAEVAALFDRSIAALEGK